MSLGKYQKYAWVPLIAFYLGAYWLVGHPKILGTGVAHILWYGPMLLLLIGYLYACLDSGFHWIVIIGILVIGWIWFRAGAAG